MWLSYQTMSYSSATSSCQTTCFHDYPNLPVPPPARIRPPPSPPPPSLDPPADNVFPPPLASRHPANDLGDVRGATVFPPPLPYWQRREGNGYVRCIPCGKYVTDEHLATSKHSERLQQFLKENQALDGQQSPTDTRPPGTWAAEPSGQSTLAAYHGGHCNVPSSSSLPSPVSDWRKVLEWKRDTGNGWPFCVLCRKYITEGHLNSKAHRDKIIDLYAPESPPPEYEINGPGTAILCEIYGPGTALVHRNSRWSPLK